ncbi:MAG: GGDEF domain-containing protein [Planctomycetes bacterium]|nr:GGDEF domain-containing protein [Planctomycetota bacterium]
MAVAEHHSDSNSMSLQERRGSIVSNWVKPLLVVASLGIVVQFAVPDSTGQLPQVVQWLLVAILLAAAGTCSSRFALAIGVLVLAGWSWGELRSLNGAWSTVVVRLAVVMGFIVWMIRVRGQLAASHRLARVDSLTGLPNRPALIEAIQAELSRAKRFQRPFSLALLDCDGFKQINDTRGHLAGDEVLRVIGRSLRHQTRKYDCSGRWGGDEFLILLCEVDHNNVLTVVERLRAAMRKEVEQEYPSLTFSLGVVTICNALTWEECVQRADALMYTAKRQGRDQTQFADL